jgi:hypothetical protein
MNYLYILILCFATELIKHVQQHQLDPGKSPVLLDTNLNKDTLTGIFNYVKEAKSRFFFFVFCTSESSFIFVFRKNFYYNRNKPNKAKK